MIKKIVLFFCLFLALSPQAVAATKYLDNAATGSGDGSSWTNAYTTFSAANAGVSAGDTLYVSGGSTTKTYSGQWDLADGASSVSRITYKIGQDAGHNGTAIFTGIIVLGNYTIFDGEYSGNRRFQVNNEVQALDKTYCKITYVTAAPDGAWNFNGDTTYYEISYCYMQDVVQDHAISFNGPTVLTWGANSIHHNTFELLHDTDGSGYGSDGLQNLTSCDIYNNNFVGKPQAGARGNHQDAIQTDGDYNRIYNNVFSNMGNYAIFYELFYSASNVQIYNNVIYISESQFNDGGQLCIAIGKSGGAPGEVVVTNYLVANNVCDYNNGREVLDMYGTGAVFDSSTIVYNNVITTTGGGFELPPEVTGYSSATNVKLSNNESNIFTNYASKDFSLKSTDTVLKNQGVSVATYFTTDILGYTRSGTWDIGAYEYGAGSTPTTISGGTFAGGRIN
jgi:hypothetical protein